jgi:hypothetical protein
MIGKYYYLFFFLKQEEYILSTAEKFNYLDFKFYTQTY